MAQNILIYNFSSNSSFSGNVKHTLEMVEGLMKKGYIFYFAGSCPIMLDEFTKKHWQIQKIWSGPEPVSKGNLLIFPFYSLYLLPRLTCNLLYYKFFKKIKAVYFLSLTEKLLMTPVAKLLGLKVYWMEHTQIDRWLIRNPYRIFYHLWSIFAQLVTVSNAIKYQLIESVHINKDRIQTIYPGLDIEDYTLNKSLSLSVSDEKFFDSLKNKFVVGAVCRLSKEKGIDFLIQAINIAKNTIPNLYCLIVGDGPEKKALEFLSKTFNLQEIVKFVGFKRQLDPYYHAFKVIALPSLKKEAFGIVAIEAMAHGLPVIASDIGGLPEIIGHEKTGYLIPPADKEALAQKIIDLYHDQPSAQAIGLAAQEMVILRFTKEKMIEEFDQLFND